MGYAPVSETGPLEGCGFESRSRHQAPVAQSGEQRPLKSKVVGSSPTRCTRLPVAQLGRASGLGPEDRGFESLQADQSGIVQWQNARL